MITNNKIYEIFKLLQNLPALLQSQARATNSLARRTKIQIYREYL